MLMGGNHSFSLPWASLPDGRASSPNMVAGLIRLPACPADRRGGKRVGKPHLVDCPHLPAVMEDGRCRKFRCHVVVDQDHSYQKEHLPWEAP